MSLSITLIARAINPPRGNRRLRPGSRPRTAVIAVIFCLLQACASHRPPECKGAFTPINRNLAASSDGTQR
jgi:hypothetical protein